MENRSACFREYEGQPTLPIFTPTTALESETAPVLTRDISGPRTHESPELELIKRDYQHLENSDNMGEMTPAPSQESHLVLHGWNNKQTRRNIDLGHLTRPLSSPRYRPSPKYQCNKSESRSLSVKYSTKYGRPLKCNLSSAEYLFDCSLAIHNQHECPQFSPNPAVLPKRHFGSSKESKVDPKIYLNMTQPHWMP